MFVPLVKALKGEIGNQNSSKISPEAKIQNDLRFDKYLSISSESQKYLYGCCLLL